MTCEHDKHKVVKVAVEVVHKLIIGELSPFSAFGEQKISVHVRSLH